MFDESDKHYIFCISLKKITKKSTIIISTQYNNPWLNMQ